MPHTQTGSANFSELLWLKYILGQYDVTCLLSKKMRCCREGAERVSFQGGRLMWLSPKHCHWRTKENIAKFANVVQCHILLWKIVQVVNKCQICRKIVKLVKKYWKIVKNCQICPKMSCPNQRLVISSLQYVPKAKGGSVLSCMYYCRLCLGNTVTGPRGSVKRVWKSIWWWKSESGLTKYENSIWLRV